MDTTLARFQEAATAFAPNLLAALVILVLGWVVMRLTTRLTTRVMVRAKLDETLISFVGNLVYMGGMAFVGIAVLGKLGVNTASFAAIIAAAGLAIGFALQGSLSNFAAGVMLIVFRPFKAGDFIEAAGVAGVVEEIQVFATILRTGDNKRLIVGNASITGGNITNYSANDTRRVDMVFGIGYGDDLEKAKRVIARVLDEDERILADPAPTIGLLELADNSVNFAARPWVKTADYWSVFFDTNERIKLAFDAEGIEIPYPQRDVHLHRTAA